MLISRKPAWTITLTVTKREDESEPILKEFKIGDLFGVVGRGTRLTKTKSYSWSCTFSYRRKENQGVAITFRKQTAFSGPYFTMFGNVFLGIMSFILDDNVIVFGKDGIY